MQPEFIESFHPPSDPMGGWREQYQDGASRFYISNSSGRNGAHVVADQWLHEGEGASA